MRPRVLALPSCCSPPSARPSARGRWLLLGTMGGAALSALAGCVAIARDAGMLPVRGNCAVAPMIHRLAPGCARLTGRVRVAPPLDPAAAAAAFDGDLCRTWNSNSPAPAWIGVDLDEHRAIDGVLLVPEVKGSPEVTHVLEISEDGEAFRPVVVLTGEMVSAEGYVVEFAPGIEGRSLRVSTERSDRVVWREIVPLACGE